MTLPGSRVLLTAGLCVAGALCACVWGSWAGVAAAALIWAALWTSARTGEESVPSAGRAVLITGCDTGFGHALALRLSGLGLQVFAGVLDSEGTGAQSLKEQDPERITVLQMDVTNPEQITQAQQQIRTQLGDRGLWGLVNNAGLLLYPVDAELHSTSCFSRLMEVNFLSAVRVTQAFLPLIRRAKGRVVNMSSLAGEVPMPRFAAYSASKAALSSFSRVLRLEMFQWGVHVALIQPSGFKTNIFGSSEDLSRCCQEMVSQTSPEALQDYGPDYIPSVASSLFSMSQQAVQDISPVLNDMVHALLSVRPKSQYCPGGGAWLLPFLHRHLPTHLFDGLITKFVKDQSGCRPTALHRD